MWAVTHTVGNETFLETAETEEAAQVIAATIIVAWAAFATVGTRATVRASLAAGEFKAAEDIYRNGYKKAMLRVTELPKPKAQHFTLPQLAGLLLT